MEQQQHDRKPDFNTTNHSEGTSIIYLYITVAKDRRQMTRHRGQNRYSDIMGRGQRTQNYVVTIK